MSIVWCNQIHFWFDEAYNRISLHPRSWAFWIGFAINTAVLSFIEIEVNAPAANSLQAEWDISAHPSENIISLF